MHRIADVWQLDRSEEEMEFYPPTAKTNSSCHWEVTSGFCYSNYNSPHYFPWKDHASSHKDRQNPPSFLTDRFPVADRSLYQLSHREKKEFVVAMSFEHSGAYFRVKNETFRFDVRNKFFFLHATHTHTIKQATFIPHPRGRIRGVYRYPKGQIS